MAPSSRAEKSSNYNLLLLNTIKAVYKSEVWTLIFAMKIHKLVLFVHKSNFFRGPIYSFATRGYWRFREIPPL